VIVIGASAGGVQALIRLVGELPEDLPAAVLVVLHIPSSPESSLARILSNAGPLPAVSASDRDPLVPGRIYVARGNHHLTVEDSHLRVTRGPRENGQRPAVDPLFRSAALAYGPRVIGVVLSGALDCGTAGLVAVKRRGGITVVQDPNEAAVGDMPRNALKDADVDHCLPVAEIGRLLNRLAREPVEEPAQPASEELRREVAIAQNGVRTAEQRVGEPSMYSCPDCGGVLLENHDGDLYRFRCSVGHAFGAETLQLDQNAQVEAALWAALRALEEQVNLAKRLAARARELKQDRSAERFAERAAAAEAHAQVVRRMLIGENGQRSPPAAATEPAPEQK
jgi:two-component system chemotaxis response regulator CheB